MRMLQKFSCAMFFAAPIKHLFSELRQSFQTHLEIPKKFIDKYQNFIRNNVQNFK